MKTPNYIVRIPEPCHEDWNKMLPDEKGKFCNSCAKSVFDFSNKTDEEIKTILIEQQGQKVCGHFKKSQINRPLNIKIDINNLPKNISITKAFVIAAFLVFGTLLFSCTDNKGQKIGEIELVSPNNEERALLGTLSLDVPVSQTNQPEEMLTGDVMPIEESGTSACISESYVDGGIGFEEVTVEEIPEAVKEEPIIDYAVLGGLVAIEYAEVGEESGTSESNSYEDKGKASSETINNNMSKLGVYPNPTNGTFSINYELKNRSDVRLNIFDVNGSFVRELVNINSQYDGKYQIQVNLNDLPNGIYIVNMISNGERTTERIVLER